MKHHEPCDHEFLEFEGDWLARAAPSTAVEDPPPEILPTSELSQWAAPHWAEVSPVGRPRAPPWRHESSIHFLETVRLLI